MKMKKLKFRRDEWEWSLRRPKVESPTRTTRKSASLKTTVAIVDGRRRNSQRAKPWPAPKLPQTLTKNSDPKPSWQGSKDRDAEQAYEASP